MLGVVLFVAVIEMTLAPAATAACRQLRRWNWHRIAVWAFVSAFVVYMIVIPAAGWIVERMQPPKTGRVLEDMSLAEQVRLRSVEALTALWFFLLGATIGSFLNVAAYRLPRGESVVFRRSRCPRCGTQIKGRDNVPVFGWLLLHGRCRACQRPISVRYPIVEAIAGAMFLLLYFVELISGGANIPVREPNAYCGVVWIIFYTKWDLVRLYLFHCFASSAILVWTLIDVDRQQVPWRTRWLLPLAWCVLPALWPDLLPVPWSRIAAFGFEPPEWLAALTTSATGGLTGAALGWFVARATVFQPDREYPADAEGPARKTVPPSGHFASAGMIAGMSVGWQAVVGVWLLVLAMRPVAFTMARRWKLREPPVTAMLLVAYVIHLIAWRWLSIGLVRWWWPGPTTTAFGWTAVTVALASLWLVNRSLSSRRGTARQPIVFTEIAAAIDNPPVADSAISQRPTASNEQGVPR
jgi:leader peptidase (prepilin peptidase)/N-methyltransferase